MKGNEKVLEWLLEPSQPVVQYFAMTELLDKKATDSEVREVRSQIPKRGWAKDILAKQKPEGYWARRKNLYQPKYVSSNWRMIVLSDFALTAEDESIRKASALFFHDWLPDKDAFLRDAEVCISGNLARFLARFGYADEAKVKWIFDWLVDAQKEDGGWHCFPSDTGTLDCWEALAAFSAIPKQKRTRRINRSIERGAEFYLERELYKEGKRYSPWFRFHYPNHYYYDLLVGLDTLTSLGFGNDKRLVYALNLLDRKMRSDGTWILEAVHPDIGSGASYAQKRKAIPFRLEKVGALSKWITLKALEVQKRIAEAR